MKKSGKVMKKSGKVMKISGKIAIILTSTGEFVKVRIDGKSPSIGFLYIGEVVE